MDLPETLQPLEILAMDQRRASAEYADELWSQVHPQMWPRTRNPYLILQNLSEKEKQALAENRNFLSLLEKHISYRKQNLEASNWYAKTHPNKPLKVAYFSMEFGLSEALPIYSGGLGILAGDHLKASSDLGLNLVGVGLLYQQGYFRQMISAQGKQSAYFPFNDPDELPIKRSTPFRFSMSLPGRKLIIRVYEVIVGKITLYLLDTNDPMNLPSDRGITSELYGGGEEMRLLQEIVLGMGGFTLLSLIGWNPDICHLNEGHAAFAVIARAREIMDQEGVDFAHALRRCRPTNIFTTHTPVEAGFDRFSRESLEHYFEDLESFWPLGEEPGANRFNMAYFAIRTCGAINGVSRLHGEVSRELFSPIFSGLPTELIPITHVTNGVHVPSWESPLADRLWSDACGPHRWMGTMPEVKRQIHAMDSQTLWDFRVKSRQQLIAYIENRYPQQQNASAFLYPEIALNPEALTLGFARRFATYKRIDLLLKDRKRLLKLFQDAQRPVQLIIAGKAHPKDEPGQKMIEEWMGFLEEGKGKIIFLSDYDILLAERLVQGVDVWINTPRRPYEASGTSGMKLLANGGLNLSEMDGWWAEAYDPNMGWAIGDGKNRGEDPAWDQKESEDLYALLEHEVIPLYFERTAEGIPEKWLTKVRASMAQCTMHFSTNRMVREYVESLYLPAIQLRELRDEGFFAFCDKKGEIQFLKTNVVGDRVTTEISLKSFQYEEIEVFCDGEDQTVKMESQGEGKYVALCKNPKQIRVMPHHRGLIPFLETAEMMIIYQIGDTD